MLKQDGSLFLIAMVCIAGTGLMGCGDAQPRGELKEKPIFQGPADSKSQESNDEAASSSGEERETPDTEVPPADDSAPPPDETNHGDEEEPSSEDEQSQSTPNGAPDEEAEDEAVECSRIGFSAYKEVASVQNGTDGSTNYVYSALQGPAELYDRIDVASFSGWGGPTTTGTYPVADVNYKDCGLCLLIAASCTTGTCTQYFYARGGSISISSIGSEGALFTGTLHDVIFREVSIANDYTSTEVENGETWCLESYSFSQALNGEVTVNPANSPADTEETGDAGSDGNAEEDVPATDSDGAIAVLGNGTHLLSSVTMEVFATSSHGLVVPKDIELNPEKADEFWVVNQGDNSVTILKGEGAAMEWVCSNRYYNANDGCDCGCGIPDPDCSDNLVSSCQYGCGAGQQINPTDPTQCIMTGNPPSGSSASTRFVKRKNTDGSGTHFLARPAGLAFGVGERLATIHEEDRVTQPSTPWDFMGPTLWTSNIQEFEGGHISHYDMLHNSPNGVGIAHQGGNVFWVFDGEHQSLTRYDFAVDHGPGGTDHSDGVVHRFVDGQLSYVPGSVSQVAYDPSSGLLYAADTGNNRIVALDTNSGQEGSNIEPNYDDTTQRYFVGATLATVINGAEHGMERPAGLELVNDTLFISDNASGRIYAFSKQGVLLDWLDLGVGVNSLNGFTFDNAGRLYVVDSSANQILRISPNNE